MDTEKNYPQNINNAEKKSNSREYLKKYNSLRS